MGFCSQSFLSVTDVTRRLWPVYNVFIDWAILFSQMCIDVKMLTNSVSAWRFKDDIFSKLYFGKIPLRKYLHHSHIWPGSIHQRSYHGLVLKVFMGSGGKFIVPDSGILLIVLMRYLHSSLKIQNIWHCATFISIYNKNSFLIIYT